MISAKTYRRQVTPIQEIPVNWLTWGAGAVSLIGMAGLFALMIQTARAEEPRTFQPGGRTFSNPYIGGTPPGGQDDEDFGAQDDFPPGGNPGGAPGGGNFGSFGAPNANDNGVDVKRTPRGISVGGNTNPGGVVSKSKVAPLKVDDETAQGSKEIITDFNFPDADILDIAKALGKLTGKNFILDKDVKGRITIISNGQITVGDAWKAFLTSLDINGFALIPSGSFIRIARQRDARDKQLKTYTGDYSPDTDALITRLFPLKYLSAEEVARNFRSFMPANSRIIPYEQTNTVIVTDTGSNISKLGKLLEILDVEGYDAGIEVIPVKFASAAELSKLVDQLIPGTGGAGGPGAPRFGGGSPGGSRFSARRTKEGGIINTIIADERTNTLIVHANTKGANQVRDLVARLDQKLPASSGGGKVHVLYLQFAEAEQIANTLNNISQGSQTAARPPGVGGTGVNPVQQSLFEGSIKIAPDKATNSLVVTASPTDFTTVQRVVNRLDIPRDQIFAEVVIMEVTVNRNFNFSTNVISPKNGIGFTPNTDLFDFINNPLSSKGAILGFKAGGETKIKVAGQEISVSNLQGLIKAIQTRSNANILATPQILALDNTEATFESAEKIPVPTVTAIQGSTSTSVTKESVSLSIKIKPQINKIANFVKLDIDAKLADISNRQLPQQVSGLAFATVERSAKTSIVVGDADTVVLGGLTRDDKSNTVSKVPLLGDIPLLGWLFQAREEEAKKTNLLLFITPHIVRQYETVRAILDKKLKERDDFLESSTGGEDPQRKYRDKMIRSLPDIKELSNFQPKRAVSIDDDGLDGTGEAKDKDKEKPSTLPGDQKGTLPPADKPPNAAQAPFNPSPQAPAPPASGSDSDVPPPAPITTQ